MLKKQDFDGFLISKISPELLEFAEGFLNKISFSTSGNYVILPGFCDVHVHLREPGFSYKETINSGTKAAARGGFTDICSMPNLNPVPDCPENLAKQLDIIKKSSVIRVHPYSAVTVGQAGDALSDFEGLAESSAAFSDDGHGVQSDEIMKSAMIKAKNLNKIIAAHCEDNNLLFGGYIHDGEYAKTHGHRGICSESEYRQIERDIKLARETGCKYHVCHISAAESVDLIRKAKAENLNITCETAPHYLVFSDCDLQENGRFKMNPPIRSRHDREALIEGILDGTIDMLATDHAPHSEQEKSCGLEKSNMGVVGLETSFSAIYTNFVMKNIISFEKLLDIMCINPRKRFSLELHENDFSVWKLDEKFTVNPDEFISMGKSTPFEGHELYGKCVLTVCGGEIAWMDFEYCKTI